MRGLAGISVFPPKLLADPPRLVAESLNFTLAGKAKFRFALRFSIFLLKGGVSASSSK